MAKETQKPYRIYYDPFISVELQMKCSLESK